MLYETASTHDPLPKESKQRELTEQEAYRQLLMISNPISLALLWMGQHVINYVKKKNPDFSTDLDEMIEDALKDFEQI